MNKMRQVAKEYNEPFIDVVIGFADMRYSVRATAMTLGFNLSTFQRTLERLDLNKYFQKDTQDMRPECRGVGVSKTKGVKRIGERKPIKHKGLWFYPGEPTHAYLFELKNRVT